MLFPREEHPVSTGSRTAADSAKKSKSSLLDSLISASILKGNSTSVLASESKDEALVTTVTSVAPDASSSSSFLDSFFSESAPELEDVTIKADTKSTCSSTHTLRDGGAASLLEAARARRTVVAVPDSSASAAGDGAVKKSLLQFSAAQPANVTVDTWVKERMEAQRAKERAARAEQLESRRYRYAKFLLL